VRVKSGVRWCRIWKDLPAAVESGLPLTSWAPWALHCEAKSSLAFDDPMPLLRSSLYRLLGERTDGANDGIWRGRC
jgi:hypothetical protein